MDPSVQGIMFLLIRSLALPLRGAHLHRITPYCNPLGYGGLKPGPIRYLREFKPPLGLLNYSPRSPNLFAAVSEGLIRNLLRRQIQSSNCFSQYVMYKGLQVELANRLYYKNRVPLYALFEEQAAKQGFVSALNEYDFRRIPKNDAEALAQDKELKVRADRTKLKFQTLRYYASDKRVTVCS